MKSAKTLRVALSTLGLAGTAASAATYSGSVLYNLPVPAGFSYATPNGTTSDAAVPEQVIGNGALSGKSDQRAVLWTGPTGVAVDLTPGAYADSYASSGYAGQQVGYAYNDPNLPAAMLWTGSASSAVNLTPALYNDITESNALGTNGSQQVGSFYRSSQNSVTHAVLWSGSAGSAIDLSPTLLPISSSKASQISPSGNQQVGSGTDTPTGQGHALLWTGSAASAVDLNPSGLGITSSAATATDGVQEVGSGNISGGSLRALLWTNTASSAVDLTPTDLNFSASQALALSGGEQVGVGSNASGYVALLWYGTGDSAVNLQSLLPASGTWTDSFANSIDSAGNIYGFAGGTYNGVTGNFAIEWTAASIPEPISLSMVAFGILAFKVRRHR